MKDKALTQGFPGIKWETMKDFDLITFDCYGTLIDWENGIYQAFRDEAARDGHELERGKVIDAYAAAEAEIEGNEFIPIAPPLIHFSNFQCSKA